jgi:stringent starvation protein B
MHEWMTDNGQTPHLVVDAAVAGVEVPRGYVKDGRVILNVSWQATQGLKLGNDTIEFSARFGGVSHHVRVPAAAVLGIYARETGQGMLFQDEEGGAPDTPTPPAPPAAPSPGGGTKPKLRVVK